MYDRKLTWGEMDETERNVFRPRWKPPVMIAMAVIGVLGMAAGMFAMLGLLFT